MAGASEAAGSADGEALSQLLSAGRDAALSGHGPLTVVIGNEAADLDSVVCAAGVAAALQSRGADACAYVAVPRADLRLRPDVEWVFHTTGVRVQALTCADELDVVQLARSGRRKLSVVLVGACAGRVRAATRAAVLPLPDAPPAGPDHNRLTRSQHDALASHVTEVIDHHEGECPYQAARQDIVQVGSCSALVVRGSHAGCARGATRWLTHCMWQAGYVQSRAPELLDNRALRTLLLSATLLDTGNLTGASVRARNDMRAPALLSYAASFPSAQSRCTDRDTAMATQLSAGMSPQERSALFDTLLAKRTDQKGLSCSDLLRKCVLMLGC